MPSSKSAELLTSDVATETSGVDNEPSAVDAAATENDSNVITMDRRSDERRGGNPDALDVGVMKAPRRKKQRRRHIDPTTCERDYSDQEVEFMRAMDDYKRQSGRMFPTCSEVLEVVRALGYVRLDDEQRDVLGLDDSGVEIIDDQEAATDTDEDWDDDSAEA